MGCSPWGHKESDTTEQVSTHRWDCWAFQMMLVVKSLPAKAVDLRGAGLIPSQEDRLELGSMGLLARVPLATISRCPLGSKSQHRGFR